MTRKRIAAILLPVMLAVLLSGCAAKGVSIDGNKASIAESKCSMTMDALTEVTYDTMQAFMDEDQAAYYADTQKELTFWIVEFRHQGDHEFSNLVWQANSGFAPDSEIRYYLDSGKQATMLAGNIGASRAYLAIPKEDALQSCEFTHKGYTLVYDFENGRWVSADGDVPEPTQRPAEAPAEGSTNVFSQAIDALSGPERLNGAYWIDIPNADAAEEVHSIAASADGTRYLMGQRVQDEGFSREWNLAIVEAKTGARTDLHLADSADVDTLLAETVPTRLDAEEAAALIERSGGKEAYLLRNIWPARPVSVEARGDFLLLFAGGNRYALVNAKTGETMPFSGSSVTLSGDGRVVVCTPQQISIYNPQNGDVSPLRLEGERKDYATYAVRLVPDGDMACTRRGIQQTYADGQTTTEACFTLLRADGSISRSIPMGQYALGNAPDQLLYSGETGVGITYHAANIRSNPARLVSKDSDTASVLWLDSPDATHAIAKDPAEVIDAFGRYTVEPACMLLPLGISQDESSVLLAELQSAGLLRMNLDTLEVRPVLTDEQFRELYALKSVNSQALATLGSIGWNGANALTGVGCPPDSAIFVPGK